jgi:DNA invertase Pin-like site-specific DNA recombinase
LRLCRHHADQQGWTIVDSYTDRAISGASLLRPGIQELIHDALRRKFVVVLADPQHPILRSRDT